MQTFGDLFKPTEDFFGKTFSYGHKVELKAASDAGVALTGEGKVEDKKFSAKVSATKLGAYRGFSVDKVEMDTKSMVKTEMSMPQVAKGTKVSFKFEDGSRVPAKKPADDGKEVVEKEGPTKAVVSVKSMQKAFSVDASVNVITGPFADVSATFGHGPFVVGGKAKVNAGFLPKKSDKIKKGFQVLDLAVAGRYTTGNVSVGVSSADNLKTAVGYGAMTTGPWAINVRAKVPVKGGKVGIDFGAKRAISDEAAIFGAVSGSGIVQVGYQLAVSKTATFTLSSKVDATKLADDVHCIGTKLSLRA